MDPFAKKMWYFSFGFGALLLFLFAALTVVYVHDRPSCPDRVAGESTSPDKKLVAAILERRCGAESPFVTRVNLRAAGPLQRGFFSGQISQGNVFTVEQDAAGAGVAVFWTDGSHLTIACPRCNAQYVTQRDASAGSVQISYELPVR